MHENVITEQDVLRVYKRQHVLPATYNSCVGAWSANSQYGYTLEWFGNSDDAHRHAVDFYLKRGWM